MALQYKNYILQSTPELNRYNVFIKNPEEVEKKLFNLIQAGLKHLQIISDFDQTITKQKTSDETRTLSSLGLLHACPSLPATYKTLTNILYDKYHPYEITNTLDKTLKSKIMLEWWQEESNILKDFQLPQAEFEEVAKNLKNKIRNCTCEMLEYANNYNVPVFIFSAGVGNAIVAILKANNMLLPNIKVVSNFLQYTMKDVINGFNDPLIHILNKNEQILNRSEYRDTIKKRPNILLLGDTIDDAEMAKDAPDRVVLRIGFIMDNEEDVIEQFSEKFDILLIDDQTMSVPFAILRLMITV